MLKYISIILFLLIGANADAQVPGYQGKRLFAEGAISFVPIIPGDYNPSLNILSAESADIQKKYSSSKVGVKYQLGLNYVIGRKVALYTNLHTFTFKDFEKLRFGETDIYAGSWSSSSNFMVSHLKLNRVNVFGTSAGFLFYARGRANIAPLGFHVKFGARISAGSIKELAHDVSFDGSNHSYYGMLSNRYIPFDSYPSHLKTLSSMQRGLNASTSSGFTVIQPELGLGYRGILKDKITFRFGIDAVLWGGARYNKGWVSINPTRIYDSTLSSTAKFINTMVRRQAVNITIGVGMLIK